MSDLALPAEILGLAVNSGEEFGWRPEHFMDVLHIASSRGLACIGGQFQWLLSDGTCEAYWLNADSTPRVPGQSWVEYVRTSENQVAQVFAEIMATTDFDKEAKKFEFLKEKIDLGIKIQEHLLFVAYFVAEKHDV